MGGSDSLKKGSLPGLLVKKFKGYTQASKTCFFDATEALISATSHLEKAMNRFNCRNFTVLACLSALTPSITLAEPTVMLEKSQAYILDNQLRAFQVPTEDSSGKVQYFDITVTLSVNDDGTLNPVADVAADPSRTIETRALVPGAYKSVDGGTVCKFTNITLTNGRIQSFVTCSWTGTKSELSFASGNISAEHPNYAELNASRVNKRTDVRTQTWGIVTNGDFKVGTCGRFDTGQPIGIKTDGNNLIMSVYNTKNAAFLCSGIFTKTP